MADLHGHRVRSAYVGTVTQRVNVSSGSEFEAAVGYSRAVRTGPHVVVAGTTAPGDGPAAQTREALRRIETALKQVNASLSDVVRTRIFVTDIEAWHEVGSVHAEVFGDIRPVTTMVEVSAPISPGPAVEIGVDACVTEWGLPRRARTGRRHPGGTR